MLANAEGEASRFKQVLVEYNKAPQVMRDRMYIETVQQIMTNSSKVLLDAKGSSNLLYLPLDKIMQMTAAGAPDSTQPSKQSLVEPAQNPNATVRSRDALRGRDREVRP